MLFPTVLMIAGCGNWDANYFDKLSFLFCCGWMDFCGFGGLTEPGGRRAGHGGEAGLEDFGFAALARKPYPGG